MLFKDIKGELQDTLNRGLSVTLVDHVNYKRAHLQHKGDSSSTLYTLSLTLRGFLDSTLKHYTHSILLISDNPTSRLPLTEIIIDCSYTYHRYI